MQRICLSIKENKHGKMNVYRAFSLLLYKRKKVMIKNILTNLKIEQLNAMQEAAIDTWKEGKDLI